MSDKPSIIAKSNHDFTYKVSLARTALKLGLEELGANPNQILLVPDYCCDVILHPLDQLGLKILYYEVSDELSPNWDQLDKIDISNVFGILMIHYFGEPQNIKKFQDYCRKKEIYLIEDNAHGYGGKYKGKWLGTFGDIGISSPRKILRTSHGGILYLLNQPIIINPDCSLKRIPFLEVVVNLLKLIVYRCQPLYDYILVQKLKKIDFSDPYEFRERQQKDTKLSIFEKYIIKNAKIKDIAKKRRKLWFRWKEYLSNQGLRPVFTRISEHSCPWLIAFYCDDISQRNFWIKWGMNNGFPLFSWPCLSDYQIKKQGSAFKRWEKIICVALDDKPPTTRVQIANDAN